MATKPLIQNTQIEVTTQIPGVMITLDLKQATFLRNLLQSFPTHHTFSSPHPEAGQLLPLFEQIGGLDVKPRRPLFDISAHIPF